MRQTALLLISILLLVGCDKPENYTPTEFQDRIIVANGLFSNTFQKQRCEISYATTINDTLQHPCETAELMVKGLSSTYSFTHIGNGIYESNAPFSAIPGLTYEISIINIGQEHKASTKMAHNLKIDSLYAYIPWNYNLLLTSEKDQYFYYEAHYGDFSNATGDTVWKPIIMTYNRVLRTQEGVTDIYLERLSRAVYGLNLNAPLFKITVHSLSDDAAEYLIKLEDFTVNNTIIGKHNNPPAFFTNNGYGIIYGTFVDEYIVQMN